MEKLCLISSLQSFVMIVLCLSSCSVSLYPHQKIHNEPDSNTDFLLCEPAEGTHSNCLTKTPKCGHLKLNEGA